MDDMREPEGKAQDVHSTARKLAFDVRDMLDDDLLADAIDHIVRALLAERQRATESAAQICIGMQEVFLDRSYAGTNPLNSFSERFACGKCAEEIRNSLNQEDPS